MFSEDSQVWHHKIVCNMMREGEFVGFMRAALFLLIASALHADDWPQWLGPQRDGGWVEQCTNSPM